MTKWARESVSKQYQDFKQLRTEIKKAKNEKRLDKIEDARKKESRTRLIKEKLCGEISKYDGLWLAEEQIEKILAEIETDSEKCAALKCLDKKLFLCYQAMTENFFTSLKRVR